MALYDKGGSLEFRYDGSRLAIEPYGPNAFRVRASPSTKFSPHDWALNSPPKSDAKVVILEKTAEIENGNIKAVVTDRGKLIIYNGNGQLLLEEYARHRRDVTDPKCSALNIEAREFKPTPGRSEYHLTARFESVDPDERIYGMGQYQQSFLNLKGIDLELAQRNSQASVPFAVSSLGYGFLWNNPSVGRAVFGRNIMSFEAYSTETLDYWVVAGDTPSEIMEAYARVTGTVPMMPEYGLGFWQCKLRYQTQEELLEVAREYKKREIPLDLIVVDFFHWPYQGEWKFDPTYWPNPDSMIKEINELGTEVMVSIWPTVDKRSENYDEMLNEGLLVRCDRGVRTVMDFEGDTVHFDATNPEARDYIWKKAKANYWDKGVKTFWLDEAEPEYTIYDFDIYRYHLGPNLSIGNIYPFEYAKAFYEGQEAAGQNNIVNLIRCAWAGSQRYGALVWSGDVASSWESFRNQVAAGLNMAMAGIPWWTTDIGGFHGGDPQDEAFRELFVRWFQWGAFCPVMRLHGDREPKQPQHGTTGGATCLSGAANEIWSYGDEVYEICKTYIKIRESLRDYTRSLMKDAHEKGTPVIQPLFFQFPKDSKAWEIEDQYTYGPNYLVAPVFQPGQRQRKVYLPEGSDWILSRLRTKTTDQFRLDYHFDGKELEVFHGGQDITVEAPLDEMPVFIRYGSDGEA